MYLSVYCKVATMGKLGVVKVTAAMLQNADNFDYAEIHVVGALLVYSVGFHC